MSHIYNLLIVDDSKVIRDGLKVVFDQDERFHVVGEAANGKEALRAVNELKPDVITLDINMPGMDGITTLKHLMIACPTPVIMMSSLTTEGAEVTFDALRFGAVDFIQKPSNLELDAGSFDNQAAEICSRVEYAAAVEVDVIHYINSTKKPDDRMSSNISENTSVKKIIALGAGEGGYASLLKVIPHINAAAQAACLVSLYAAPEYVSLFAEYLNNHSVLNVKTAEHNEVIKPGVCYLRSGADYMSVHKQEDEYVLHISPAPFASRKGSIDMLLFSTADVAANDAVGVILSGSGKDGVEGSEEILRVGGRTIIQDPKSCLSSEMPASVAAKNSMATVTNDLMIADVINDAINN